MKKKFTGPNQPVRKLYENGLPGKHRETCLHGAELYLWEEEPGEQHLPQTQKGDQSRVGGVRAKPEPESRRSWLGVRCQHRHPALAAQHFSQSCDALSDSCSQEMHRGALHQQWAAAIWTCSPATASSLALQRLTGQGDWKRSALCESHPLHLPNEHLNLLL